MTDLAALLGAAAAGSPPPADGEVIVIDPPDDRPGSCGRTPTVWTVPGGILMLGRGVAGRWEIAVEVDESARGQGLGRTLFSAGLGLIPPGERLWAQVAPGNAM